MAKQTLRIEQYETVLYNSNLNPMGVPETIMKAMEEHKDCIIKYPIEYYGALKDSISKYVSCPQEHIILGNGSSDLIRLFTAIISPKKALVAVPSASEYANVLNSYACEIVEYTLDEAKDYVLDVKALASSLDSSLDMIILGNPNNPTSQIIQRDDMEFLAEVCKQLDIFLLVDEMYIEFVNDYKDITCVSLTEEYDNLAIMRGVSKVFAVPGLRFSYAIMNNLMYMQIINLTSTPNSLSTLTTILCTELFKDTEYIEASRSQIHTERNLIYSAMFSNKNMKLYKPYANFMLVKILTDKVTAKDVAEHCKERGIVIRNCEDIHGLDNKYFRFCFMKPKQNDLLVNTILELF